MSAGEGAAPTGDRQYLDEERSRFAGPSDDEVADSTLLACGYVQRCLLAGDELPPDQAGFATAVFIEAARRLRGQP